MYIYTVYVAALVAVTVLMQCGSHYAQDTTGLVVTKLIVKSVVISLSVVSCLHELLNKKKTKKEYCSYTVQPVVVIPDTCV